MRRQIFRSLELKFLNFPETRLNVVIAEGSLFLSKGGSELRGILQGITKSQISSQNEVANMSKFKLFNQLLERLMREPSAFAIVNSAGDVDIESMAWSQVPAGVQAAAMEMAQRMLAAREVSQLTEERRFTIANYTSRSSP